MICTSQWYQFTVNSHQFFCNISKLAVISRTGCSYLSPSNNFFPYCPSHWWNQLPYYVISLTPNLQIFNLHCTWLSFILWCKQWWLSVWVNIRAHVFFCDLYLPFKLELERWFCICKFMLVFCSCIFLFYFQHCRIACFFCASNMKGFAAYESV